ncbi:hypothetical protein [Frankia sp. AgB32]|uniref:hypothetical protein n=1 Tax=Frankia sp. AgB32 TaxID=631119 RepID=UPI00200D8F40|nr:hypothetical protein [Frankia sp. AgB32]MCK9897956.1 hypothetical protein [Frankia sp. AgB32]
MGMRMMRLRNAARFLLAASVLIAPVGIGAQAALASGTSPTTNGCYSTWGSTGTNAHCFNVTVTGNYRNHAFCSAQFDKVSSALYMTRGSTVNNWGQLNCTFSVTRSRVDFTG